MKIFNKVLFVLLALSMVCFFVGCSNPNGGGNDNPSTPDTPSAPAGGDNTNSGGTTTTEVIYSLAFIADAGGTTLVPECYSVTGGSFSGTIRTDKTNNIVRETDGYFTFPLQGGDETFVCTGNFKAGDVVTIEGYIKNDANKSGTIKVNGNLPDGVTDATSENNKGFANITEGGFNYVDGNPSKLTWTLEEDATELTIKRNSGSTESATNVFVISVEVTR